MGRRPVAPVWEAHCVQRRVNTRPDRIGRHAAVLEPERDVVSGPSHDELGVGVLEHDGHPIAGLRRRASVEQESPLRLGAAGGREQPGEPEQ